jgi:hypothetical protein
MFRAAFTSRSWTVRHAVHCQARTSSGFGPSSTPQAEQNRPDRHGLRPGRPFTVHLKVGALAAH